MVNSNSSVPAATLNSKRRFNLTGRTAPGDPRSRLRHPPEVYTWSEAQDRDPPTTSQPWPPTAAPLMRFALTLAAVERGGQVRDFSEACPRSVGRDAGPRPAGNA